MGVFPEDPTQRPGVIRQIRNDAARDKFSLSSRVMKDTISIPARGYAVLRFKANNPGN